MLKRIAFTRHVSNLTNFLAWHSSAAKNKNAPNPTQMASKCMLHGASLAHSWPPATGVHPVVFFPDNTIKICSKTNLLSHSASKLLLRFRPLHGCHRFNKGVAVPALRGANVHHSLSLWTWAKAALGLMTVLVGTGWTEAA